MLKNIFFRIRDRLSLPTVSDCFGLCIRRYLCRPILWAAVPLQHGKETDNRKVMSSKMRHVANICLHKNGVNLFQRRHKWQQRNFWSSWPTKLRAVLLQCLYDVIMSKLVFSLSDIKFVYTKHRLIRFCTTFCNVFSLFNFKFNCVYCYFLLYLNLYRLTFYTAKVLIKDTGRDEKKTTRFPVDEKTIC